MYFSKQFANASPRRFHPDGLPVGGNPGQSIFGQCHQATSSGTLAFGGNGISAKAVALPLLLRIADFDEVILIKEFRLHDIAPDELGKFAVGQCTDDGEGVVVRMAGDGYVREFNHKLTGKIGDLEAISISEDASAKEKTDALKALEKAKAALRDVEDYERNILLPLAQQRIEIDLDDGVKANYPKFGKALAPVTGLSKK